jgi:hypothetical protein
MNRNKNEQNLPEASGAKPGLRRLAIVAVGIGLGAILSYWLSKTLGALSKTGEPALPRLAEHIVDDHGTGQAKAAKILRNLRDRAFESSDEKLALALGRPMAKVAAWSAGQEIIDDDVIMKARGIAMNRGVHVE